MRQAAKALLDTKQLAKALGCCARTVHAMKARGCPHVRIGWLVRYDMDSVMAWLASRQQGEGEGKADAVQDR